MEIPQLQRKKTIVFRDDEMREILAITETYPSAFDKKLRTSVAKRKSVKWVDYWNKNKAGDAVLRQDMGLGGW